MESKEERKKRVRDESDRKRGYALRIAEENEIKRQLGEQAANTIFNNPNNLVALFLGVGFATVERKVAEALADTTPKDIRKKEKQMKKKNKKRVLDLITSSQQKEIRDHIEACYISDSNFTLHSLLIDLKEKFSFPFKKSTLHKILQAMNIVHKIKTYNPMASARYDLIGWRARYLKEIAKMRESGVFITYFDETWIFHGMTKRKGWVTKHKSAYEIARMGSLKNPVPGFRAASDKGIRAIVLAVLTESSILPGSIEVITSKRPASEQLLDYHKTMDSDAYKKYMELIIPLVAAAAPTGRQAVLVIDNCPIHNKPLLKIPTKSSSKSVLAQFLNAQGIAYDLSLTRDALWKEAEIYINANGGKTVMTKYEVDEMAKQFGVKILRLPPYHCCLNLIELIWSQLKTYLRPHGKVDNKIDVVCFFTTFKGTIVNTIEHVVNVESDLKTIMDAEFEEELQKNEDSDDDEDDLA
uniref:39S ribosomal protein L52, mitochondrial n=1 Tax=Caenorhabditis tropicalis TaxID=1561998 RepID=A0A1I7UWU8_9PELO